MNLHFKIQYVVLRLLKKGIKTHASATRNQPLQSPEFPVNGAIVMAVCLYINIFTISGTERGQSRSPCQRYAAVSAEGGFLHLQRPHHLFFAQEVKVQSSTPRRTLLRSLSQAHVGYASNGSLSLRLARAPSMDLLQRGEKTGEVDLNS